MYTFLIKHPCGKETKEVFEGHWPCDYVLDLWKDGYRFAVISTYSNTLKVPTCLKSYGEYEEVIFEEFNL